MPKLFEYIDLNDLSAFKTEYDKKVEADITTAKNEIEQSSNGAYASYMTVEQNATTGVVTFKLYSTDETLLDTKTLDLDTEHIIKSISLDYANEKLVFTMADDTTIECSISSLITEINKKITYLEVNNIQELTNAQCNSLRCGDIVAKVDSTGKHSYEVSYKKDNVGLCLTYKDATYTETISYDYINENWVFNSKDSLSFDTKADKVPSATENNIAIFDSNGNVKDSGKSLNDTGKIDSVSIDGTPVVPDQNKNVDLPAYPTKTSLGLDNVDNTSDADKPVSTAQQTALNLKADKDTTYTKTETDNLLNGKVNIYEVSDVTALTNAQCEALICGDVLIKNVSGSKHTYVVSYKKSNEMCLTYTDHENIEEVYYEKDSAWAYVQTDITNLLDNEKVGNKVTTFGATPSDNKYPSEKLVKDTLDLKALITETGNKIDLEINNSNFKIKAILYDKNNNIISTSSEIDLPLESVVVNGSYDSQTKKVILTLQNGSTIEFSVADLISGLQTQIDAQHKLSSDLVDDAGNTNKFVTTSEKNLWNAKVNAYEVTDITALTTAQVNTLKVGDVVVKNENGNKHNYIVTYKENEVGICLTYTDAENVETVSYDYTGGAWVYNSTDYTTISNRQPLLVNQQNIKSVNGQSLLGSGNISIQSGLNVKSYFTTNFEQISISGLAEEVTWNSLNVWSDGENTYFSSGTYQYVFNKENLAWETKVWTGLTDFNGKDIWTDGENIYYSAQTSHYILDKTTSNWSAKTWSGLTDFNGEDIWLFNNKVFYSNSYILSKTTSTWVSVEWQISPVPTVSNPATVPDKSRMFIFNNNVYVLGNSNIYKIDTINYTATAITFDLDGLATRFLSYSNRSFSDGINIYLLNGSSTSSNNRILDKENSSEDNLIFKKIMLQNISISVYASVIWSDGENYYASKDYRNIPLKIEDVDSSYNPQSLNPQSGTAVAQAIASVYTKTETDTLLDNKMNADALAKNNVTFGYLSEAYGYDSTGNRIRGTIGSAIIAHRLTITLPNNGRAYFTILTDKTTQMTATDLTNYLLAQRLTTISGTGYYKNGSDLYLVYGIYAYSDARICLVKLSDLSISNISLNDTGVQVTDSPRAVDYQT